MTRSEQYADRAILHLRAYWTTPDSKLDVPEDRLKTALATAFLEGALSVIEEMHVQKEPCMADFPGMTEA